MVSERKYWFKRKRYGWGWVPVTWQGWLSVAAYIVIVVGAGLAFLSNPVFLFEVALFFVFFASVTICLLRIAMSKGPPPRWRWGKKTTDKYTEDI